MRMLLIAAAAILSLAGCQTTTVDTAIKQNLPKICSAALTAHTAFVSVAPLGNVSAGTIRKEAAAWASLEPLCVDPHNQDAATVLVAAATAYTTITIALRDAE